MASLPTQMDLPIAVKCGDEWIEFGTLTLDLKWQQGPKGAELVGLLESVVDALRTIKVD